MLKKHTGSIILALSSLAWFVDAAFITFAWYKVIIAMSFTLISFMTYDDEKILDKYNE